MHVHQRRRWILLLAVIAMGVLLWIVGGHFEVRAWMSRVVEMVRDAGLVPFLTAMALLPAIGFPLSAFTFMAGPAFGPTIGVGAVVLGAIAAIAINVALSYWLASRALRPVAEWVVRRLGYRLPVIQPHAAWFTIVVLRVVPITPFFLQSILLGLARVPFGAYMIVSVLVPSMHAAAIIVFGDAFMRGDRWAMAAAGALIIIIGTILHFMRKRWRDSAASLRETREED